MGLKKKLLFSSKSTRRSWLCRKKRANRSIILSLPHEIIHEMLLKAGDVSHDQFKRTKKVCRTFRNVMEEDWYHREIDLWQMEISDWHYPQFSELKELCLQLGNPSAIYLRGISCVFIEGMQEEGLDLIRQAAENGYDLAIYANACLQRIIHPTRRFDDDVSREFVIEARNKLKKNNRTPWTLQNPQWFMERKALINVSSIKECKCIPNYGWELPFKGPGACDRCFWKKETWHFAEKFTNRDFVWPL